MKKILLVSAIALGALAASAETYKTPGFFDNWSYSVQGGVTTPLKGYRFIKSMRPIVGLNLEKQITPAFAVGVEGIAGFNTSSWEGKVHSSTAIDDSYVGAYGALDLFNLFGGYHGRRLFSIEAQAGAGWGHVYLNKEAGPDHNYFATKAGLNFNFNVSDHVTINISPSVYWDMSDANVAQTTAAYDANLANFNLMAGVTYHMGGRKFEFVRLYNQAEIDALNGQINSLRAGLEGALATSAAWEAKAGALDAELQECLNRPVEVKKEVQVKTENRLNSVRYVFFRIGSSNITADQQPNVEMIADFLKSHPTAKVVIKGYASKDGPEEVNLRLAAARAQSVKDMLIKRYKIAESRIQAEGEGIGEMFEEESWNRVSICTIEQNEK